MARDTAMLTTLRIKNLALVTDLTLELQPGCNIITGETGAGKSIILGALNLVLGERADRTLIRSGEESCSVEAVFDVRGLQTRSGAQQLKGFLEENGLEPCEDHRLVLKRTFTATGTNRQFINGSPTTLATLASLGERLVDVHGPHDHQSLLHSARQLDILDAFGGLEGDRAALRDLVRRRNVLAVEKSALIVDEKTYAQQLELLRHQVLEISAARLQPGEEERVEAEFHRASNAAKLLQLSQAALEVLSESDASLLTQSGAVGRVLAEIQRVDAGAAHLIELHAQATETMRELRSAVSHYADKVEVDPARLAELEERLDLLHTLKRKYGGSLDAVIAFGEETRTKLRALESRAAELARLDAALEKLDGEIVNAGKKLSAARKKVIPHLAKSASQQLEDLGFKQSKFDVAVGQDPPGPASAIKETGFDEIEFQFAPNPGEPAKALRAIASSGEMARVMLALKTVLAAEDEIPVLIFDEVDANVGGETANAVGEKMKQIAAKRQVFCITHLPQVASVADAHYVVSKQVKNGRTISDITLLDKQSRVTELARMLGGQSDAARKHAEALLAR
ncbi:MAG TPA: DNA repair protein RecN [Candidatus Acidoferrales bacterium]|nr:DNA repair protein RecN [Candidatus Acidoferrales bacterium]